jgi:small-conductance mechanosensitive channel
MALILPDLHAVLKERNLEQTLSVLRQELISNYHEMEGQSQERRRQNKAIRNELMETMKRSNQNALMLYSQNNEYVFDLTYACHEATEQYQQFQRQQLPFKQFLESHDAEIAKYDSLILSLRHMPVTMLSQRALTDRNVCLTLATNIRNTIDANRSQTKDFIRFYEMSEQRLKNQDDYAQKRYNEIQRGIFMNGSDNYFVVLRNIKDKFADMIDVLREKYRSTPSSQWDSRIIFGLFFVIFFYIIVAILLNLLTFRFLIPRRFRTAEFMKKRSSIIMATTTITFALVMAIFRNVGEQNFFIMASNLLIEYAWLLGVILMSLLLRVNGSQIASAFRIYAPLVVIGFMVIAFRIVLIPKELVNLLFPFVLLLATLWQWSMVSRHNQNVPRQDMFYTYISLTVFIVSLICSWLGYTLLAVQIIIWWIMQLTCILTITCLSSWMSYYSEKHDIENKPITKTWFYLFIYHVLMPVMGVCSVMLSIYWAADVFNLSDLCWNIFRMNFIDMENLNISILKLTMVVCLWFVFRYIASTLLAFMSLHFQIQDPSTATSRTAMSRNIVQVLIWGIWLLLSLGALNISLTWLLAISGGLSTGIGFASKNIIENIFYGATLMAGRLKVGDMIEVDGTMGKVQQISYTSTVVESMFGEVITFQNSQLFDKNYKNLTRNHGYVLTPVEFGVAYGTNLHQVQQLVEEAVNNMHNEFVDQTKEAKAIVTMMNESSIDFKISVWAEAVKRAAVKSEVLRTIYETLNENGIEIPFPQRDVHIIK